MSDTPENQKPDGADNAAPEAGGRPLTRKERQMIRDMRNQRRAERMEEEAAQKAEAENNQQANALVPGKPEQQTASMPIRGKRGQRSQELPFIELDEAEREEQIRRVQLQLVKRRRRRLLMMLMRLAFFIFLPTALIGHYYYNYASSLFATKSSFVIQSSLPATASAGLGGMMSASPLTNATDSILVQDYLSSQEVMRQLDREMDLIAHMQQEWIDPIQRLPQDASEKEAYDMYLNRVEVGFDPTEGVIRMEVQAFSPEYSQALSLRLISLAEARISQLSDRQRSAQLGAAEDAYHEAEDALAKASEKVLSLQEQLGIFDANAEVAMVQSIIQTQMIELDQKERDLATLLENPRPNATRKRQLEDEIRRLEDSIAERRAEITKSGPETASLARINAELNLAETERLNREAMLTMAWQQKVEIEQEVSTQSRFLAVMTNPIQPDVATYPRKFEYTVFAFIIFGAAYMIMSLTASILREQMSY